MGQSVAIIILLGLIGVINWHVCRLRERVEKLERAMRELNPGLGI